MKTVIPSRYPLRFPRSLYHQGRQFAVDRESQLSAEYSAETAKKVFQDMEHAAKACSFQFPHLLSNSRQSWEIAKMLPELYWMCAVCFVELRKRHGDNPSHNVFRVIPSDLLRLLIDRVDDLARKLLHRFNEVLALEKESSTEEEMKTLIDEEMNSVLLPSLKELGDRFRTELDSVLDDFYTAHSHANSKEPHTYFSLLEDFYACPIEMIRANTIKLDIQGMAGGAEAWAFASDLRDMYYGYLQSSNHSFSVERIEQPEKSSSRGLAIRLTKRPSTGDYCDKDDHTLLRCLFFDSGVHRIQRVPPQSESHGRIHTSTASLALIPEIALALKEKSLKDSSEMSLKSLEEECDISWTHGSGPGGQAVNTGSNCCALFHQPTRTSLKCHASRSALENKRLALESLRKKLKALDDEKKQKKIEQIRRMQQHTGERNEKIRSFNVIHNTVIDHRLNLKVSDCNGMLACQDRGAGLQTFYDKLIAVEDSKRAAASVLELQQALFAAAFP